MPRTLQPCGTDAAYRRHFDHDEPACDPCKAAHAAKEKLAYRAAQRLRTENRARYGALLNEELATAGLRRNERAHPVVAELIHVLACAMGVGRRAQ
jgi:hypothetical protein